MRLVLFYFYVLSPLPFLIDQLTMTTKYKNNFILKLNPSHQFSILLVTTHHDNLILYQTLSRNIKTWHNKFTHFIDVWKTDIKKNIRCSSQTIKKKSQIRHQIRLDNNSLVFQWSVFHYWKKKLSGIKGWKWIRFLLGISSNTWCASLKESL